MNVKIHGNAKIISNVETQAIAIAMMNTGYDQIANITIENTDNTGHVAIFTQEDLAHLAEAKGYTYNPTASTDLTVKADGTVIYPVVNEEEPKDEG